MKRDELLENTPIRESETVETALLQIGEILAVATLKTQRYDEAKILDELAGAFSYALSCYGQATNRIPEDLGVNLAEGSAMKLSSYEKDSSKPSDDEWRHYVEDSLKRLVEIRSKVNG